MSKSKIRNNNIKTIEKIGHKTHIFEDFILITIRRDYKKLKKLTPRQILETN